MPVSIFLIVSFLVILLIAGVVSWIVYTAENNREIEEIRERLGRLGGCND